LVFNLVLFPVFCNNAGFPSRQATIRKRSRTEILEIDPPPLFLAQPVWLLKDFGKGKVACLPWKIGGLYYKHSSEAHAGLMRDLIDHLLLQGAAIEDERASAGG
jgi:hypothetical protein